MARACDPLAFGSQVFILGSSGLQFGDFFLVVPPAFATLAHDELKLKQDKIAALCRDVGFLTGDWEWQVNLGQDGINILGLPLEVGFALNIFLKIPTRILLRLKSFRCRDFPKLYKQTQKIAWEQFIDWSKVIKIKASASKSRLMILKRIESTVADGISKVFAHTEKTAVDCEADVYVRIFDDTCTLSIDTSGLPLYKRHQGKKVGDAPIRETIAAALLLKMKEYKAYCPENSLSLVDPMLGSGTFFLEAKTFGIGTQRQDYAFLTYPYIRNKNKGDKFSKLFGYDLQIPLWENDCIGYDRSEKMISCAKENLKNLTRVSLKHQDIFADLEHEISNSVILICNPPYGKRIGFGDRPSAFFNKLLLNILEKWKPCLTAIIVPDEILRDKKFKVPDQFNLVDTFKFLNGGVKVSLLLLVRS